jgi:DNA-binding NarL/FixJ family response regulator
VAVADDHRLISEGIRVALEEKSEFKFVGSVASGLAVLPLVKRTRPHVLILDLRMPGADGLYVLGQVKRHFPRTRVAICSVTTDSQVIRTVLERGVDAYIVKADRPIDLPSILRLVMERTIDEPIGMPDAQRKPEVIANLTDREVAILYALARGLSNEAIGRELWVAEQTVKFHLTNIYRKLGVSNRTGAARFAYQHGLVEPPLLPRS